MEAYSPRIPAPRPLALLPWIALSVICLSGPALANDTWLEGAGGTIKAMNEHPSVAMESELVEVSITESTATVHCTFVFQNDGAATRVKMGFPESAGGDVDVKKPRGFRSFRSWVDGKPVPTKIEGLVSKEEFSWERWRTKVVDFATGQTRRVEVRYEQPLGASAGETISKFFTYQFSTGASWKGSITRAKLVLRFERMGGYSFTDRPLRDGDTLVKEWLDFEPTEDDDFYIEFYSPPPKVLLNGELLRLDWEVAALPAYRRTGLYVPVRWLARKIGATVTWDPATRTGRLTREQASLALTTQEPVPRDPKVITGILENAMLLVPPGSVVVALGGSVDHWWKVNKLVLTLPRVTSQ